MWTQLHPAPQCRDGVSPPRMSVLPAPLPAVGFDVTGAEDIGRRGKLGAWVEAQFRPHKQYERELAARLNGHQVEMRVFAGYGGGLPDIRAFVSGYEQPVLLTLTEEALVVTRWANRPGPHMIEVLIGEIERAEIEPWSDEHSRYGWEASTGFLHGAKSVQATSGLLLTLTGERQALFRIQGPPVKARVMLAPLLKRVGS